MDNSAVQLVGGPCGQHGPYTFYKAFKYTKDGIKRIITLSEFFFVKLWMDSDLLCIGELQLLWIDKNSEQVLASLRLYFLPENTPEGRMDHGEDEVLAISEKVVLRVEDLITWITVDAEWSWGRLGKCVDSLKEFKKENDLISTPFSESSLDFTDVEKERKLLDVRNNNKGPAVIILSYPRYCRYRSVMKRLEGVEDEYLKHRIANALGGFSVSSDNTRILFCRDTFDYPELEGHELLCNHLAPKLKGRPRGKRKKRSLSPGSESNESECSITIISTISKTKILSEGAINGLRGDGGIAPRRSTRTIENTESKAFIKKLTMFMKANHTPIGRIPSLGYKELDLFSFYTKVQKLGGYDSVTTNRLWKSIFDDLSGNHASTSAATVIRRHYERFLLSYERHEKGEENKPLPVSERRRLKNKANRSSASDAETSEGTSRSGNSTPVPQLVACTSARASPQPSCSSASDYKEPTTPEKVKPEAKTSSLRSVRVKPDRLRDQLSKTESILLKNDMLVENNNVITNASEPVAEINEDDQPSPVPADVEFSAPPVLDVVESSSKIFADVKQMNIIEKDNEPITSAATPVQKTVAEKAPSPVEGKESLPLFDASNGKQNEPNDDLTETPFRPPASPEIIDLDSDTYKNITSTSSTFNETIIVEVKKQKLDILKQGGLEVTPVCNATSPQSKEMRPSVIHQAINSSRVEIIPNEKRQMPPPLNPALPKRSLSQPKTHKHVNNYEIRNIFSQSPPKVVQSKSIYSPSEKTVYGDPKEIFTVTPPRVQAPKFIDQRLNRQTGGGILDLTVKSPQKPTVEIMQIPHPSYIPFAMQETMQKPTFKSPPLPLLDGRKVGSNLEITLVGPNDHSRAHLTKPHLYDKYLSMDHSKNHHQHHMSNNKMPPQKRSFDENFMAHKMPRVEEKMRPTYSTQLYPPKDHHKKSDFESSVSTSYFHNKSSNARSEREPIGKSQSHNPALGGKQYPSVSPMVGMSNYLPHLSGVGKGIPPYMPTVEALYYSTLQRMYSPSLPLVPQLIPVPTPEQLKFYQDLMVNNSRIRLPFFAQDGTSVDSNLKKQ